ncbi:MAG: hypothetical protein PVH61_01580 [Candidatus Aminicenantes bacterium]|jgi:hypothetical protein
MLIEKSVENFRSKSIKNTDITTKKIKTPLECGNPLISSVSTAVLPGIADIAVKKKIKDLTFIFGCAKRMG